jgi:hypothetical protein
MTEVEVFARLHRTALGMGMDKITQISLYTFQTVVNRNPDFNLTGKGD